MHLVVMVMTIVVVCVNDINNDADADLSVKKRNHRRSQRVTNLLRQAATSQRQQSDKSRAPRP